MSKELTDKQRMRMYLSQMQMRQRRLWAWVAVAHQTQVRKYNNEPYIMHVTRVAQMAENHCMFGYEIGLCHDIIEDFECTQIKSYDLRKALHDFGYLPDEEIFIVNAVLGLSNLFTAKQYPDENRFTRARMEADRLGMQTYTVQTVKYCDIIDNISTIVENDPNFAPMYLEEKRRELDAMMGGDHKLRATAIDVLQHQLLKLHAVKEGIIGT